MVRLQIQNKSLDLKNSIEFLIGNLNLRILESEFPFLRIDWKTKYTNYFEENKNLNNIIFKSYLEYTAPKQNEIKTLDKLWKEYFQYIRKLHRVSKVYSDVCTLRNLVNEKQSLNENLEKYKKYEQHFDRLRGEAEFQHKQDLLLSIKKDLAEFEPEFQIQKDEFQVHHNRMKQFLDAKKQYKRKLNDLKQDQRELYRETNKLTDEMDALSPRMRVYQDKLEKLDPNKDSKDYTRIHQKFQKIEDEYSKLRTQRSDLMKKSKQIKKDMLRLKRSFKESTSKTRKFEPKYKLINEEFTQSKNKFESYQKRIKELENDLNSLISENDSLMTSDNLDAIPFTNKSQLDSAIIQIKKNIKKIDIILKKNLGKTNIEEINLIINSKLEKIQDKVNNLKKSSENWIQSDFQSFLPNFIDFYFKYIEIFSRLSKFVNIELHSEVFLNKNDDLEKECIQFNQTIYLNDKAISLEDINRVKTAFLFYSFIISFHLSLDQKIILISLEKMPHAVKTLKTFQTTVDLLSKALKNKNFKEEVSVVFLLNENKYNFDNIIEF